MLRAPDESVERKSFESFVSARHEEERKRAASLLTIVPFSSNNSRQAGPLIHAVNVTPVGDAAAQKQPVPSSLSSSRHGRPRSLTAPTAALPLCLSSSAYQDPTQSLPLSSSPFPRRLGKMGRHLSLNLQVSAPTISYATRQEKGAVYYPIILSEKTARRPEHTVSRRYSDFAALQKELIATCEGDGRPDGYALGLAIRQIPFPSRGFFEYRYHPELIERRRAMFQHFLHEVLRWSANGMFCATLRRQLTNLLEGFLELSKVLQPQAAGLEMASERRRPELLVIQEKENESMCSSDSLFLEMLSAAEDSQEVSSYSISVGEASKPMMGSAFSCHRQPLEPPSLGEPVGGRSRRHTTDLSVHRISPTDRSR